MSTHCRLFTTLFAIACVWSANLGAQQFRKVTSSNDLVSGARYVFAISDASSTDSLYVMRSLATTGTDSKVPAADKYAPDSNGRIEVDSTLTAIFELTKSGAKYSFRNVATDGWLAYNTKTTSSSSAPLYSMTDEDLEEAPTTASKAWYKTFSLGTYFTSEGRSPFITYNQITVSSDTKNYFHILFDKVSHVFRLYRLENGDTVYIYKEVETPTVAATEHDDWTFHGEWTADTLYRTDFSQATRIDFTDISLPEGKMAGSGCLPKDYVWTYVAKGDAGKLPDGWPNVIEVSCGEGKAATRIMGCDSCRFGAKYPFTVPAGTAIEWYRTAFGDGSWQTLGLPFAADAVTWESADGETATVERLAYDGMTTDGAVFHLTGTDESWQAGTPYLWRTPDGQSGTVCFQASGTSVLADEETIADENGFHATYGLLEIESEEDNVFLLDQSGERFVRAAAGSWAAASRAYLVYAQGGVQSLGLKMLETTGVTSATADTDGVSFPIYGADGQLKGYLRTDEPMPSSWPRGLYVTPFGKVLKR